MIVERIWTGNAYRNYNYLIACPDTGEALANLARAENALTGSLTGSMGEAHRAGTGPGASCQGDRNQIRLLPGRGINVRPFEAGASASDHWPYARP